MLLYVTGSYPDSPEGIAAAAKILLDSMIEMSKRKKIILLTTDIPIISNRINENVNCKYRLIKNWKFRHSNIKEIYSILDKYPITAVHMEYPGDLYGKTFLASFLPYIIHRYNRKRGRKISVNVRLHEFTRARFLRKVAIIPIVLNADRIYIPAQKDREVVSKFAKNRVFSTKIGTNIKVVPDEVIQSDQVTISYFGSVYPGKGIEKMLSVWKKVKQLDKDNKFRFKIIGDIGIEEDNHFAAYHRQVRNWIKEYGLIDNIEVTGYISDEKVSKEIQKTQIATLFYEDGLTLRRGSFLAYLAHGIPIVTSQGDDEAAALFSNHPGIRMADSEEEIIKNIIELSNISKNDREIIKRDNIRLSEKFNWRRIAYTFMKEYGIEI